MIICQGHQIIVDLHIPTKSKHKKHVGDNIFVGGLFIILTKHMCELFHNTYNYTQQIIINIKTHYTL